jgi:hypothetical protein
LDRWWDQGLTLGAREAANNRRPWNWEVDGHGGVFTYYGGDDVMSSAGENSEIYVALRSFWYNKKSWGDLPPWAGDFPRKEKINRFESCSISGE